MVHSTLQGDHTDGKTLEGLEAAVVVMALVVLEEVVGVEATEVCRCFLASDSPVDIDKLLVNTLNRLDILSGSACDELLHIDTLFLCNQAHTCNGL